MSAITNVDRVRQIREADPLRAGASIAKELGLSRERVRQILSKLEMPTRFYPEMKECSQCHTIFEVRRNRKFCSRDCANKSKVRTEVVEANCGGCGAVLYRRPYRIRSKSGNVYCNKECQHKAFAAKAEARKWKNS
jgi:NADH pyrophosphatase NudC (nudix superfamily)